DQLARTERLHHPETLWWWGLRAAISWGPLMAGFHWLASRHLVPFDPESGALALLSLAGLGILLGVWRLIREIEDASLREFLGEGDAGSAGFLALLGAALPGLAALAWVLWRVPRPLIGDTLMRLGLLYLFILGFESSSTRFRLRKRFLGLRDQVLRFRLAPHFLFNTLASLRAQMDSDPDGAKATADRLSQLFRELLKLSGADTIPLGRELGFVEAYLGIELARMGRRLHVRVEVPEALEQAVVPPLALQVLVENAVKHGVAPLEQGGEIRIGAELQPSLAQPAPYDLKAFMSVLEPKDLVVWVEDPGTGQSNHRGSGTALDSLRQRLAKPEDLTLERTASGFRVAFRWRQA
ncbi:MAG TPA: histidine kinase, partial [Holophagaceae bacterium]